MAFGKAFATRKEALEHMKKMIERNPGLGGLSGFTVRKMSKKLFPRRKKLFHVGLEIDFLNFA